MTIDELMSDYSWQAVFADKITRDDGWVDDPSSGNCTKDTEAIGNCSATPPSRDDVAEIVASENGENDGPAWIGVFKLKDERYLFARGSCDYTGWD